MKVKISDLKAKVSAGVAKLGYSGDDAHVITEVLLYAQFRGNNQGIAKIATGGVPKAIDVAPYEVVSRRQCGAHVTGGHSMVATAKAAALAVEIAREHGVGIVGSTHALSSSGAIGYFSKQIAEAGLIGIICRGTPPFVTPHGSSEPKLGTNPLSYAFPTAKGLVVFDMATSIVAGYGVVEAKLKGEPLQEGIAFNKEGEPTTDAAQVWPSGAIVPFGGYKGFGLSVLVQLLGGPFVGGSFAGLGSEKGPGTFVLAIDPGLLVSRQEYMTQAEELVGQIKSARPLPNENEILIPGERGDRVAEEVTKSGEIEVADAIWSELNTFLEG